MCLFALQLFFLLFLDSQLSSFVSFYNEYISLYFEHFLSKKPLTPYCPLLNDKILTKKKLQQSSQHVSGLLGFDERFSRTGCDSEAIILLLLSLGIYIFFIYIQIIERKHWSISVSCWSKNSFWKWLTDWLGGYGQRLSQPDSAVVLCYLAVVRPSTAHQL